MTSPNYADIQVGDRVARSVTRVSRTQLFLFSAATYNAHRIHYDHTWATETEGLRDVVVHGPLHAALISRTVTDWMGPAGRLREFSLRHGSPAFADDEIECEATVVDKVLDGDRGLVYLEVSERNAEGTTLGTGRACVALPAPEVGR